MSPLAPPTQSITASSRHSAGSLFHYLGRVPRVVNTLSAGGLEAFPASPSGLQPMASGTVVPARARLPAECSELLADSGHFELIRVQHIEGSTRWLRLFEKR